MAYLIFLHASVVALSFNTLIAFTNMIRRFFSKIDPPKEWACEEKNNGEHQSNIVMYWKEILSIDRKNFILNLY